MEIPSSLKINSRKRKNSDEKSSNPLVGIFTRSKSQIYFQRNRSSIARPDTHFPAKIEQAGDDFLEVNSTRVSVIKDLRARRVFTPDVHSVLLKEEEEVEFEEDVKKGGIFESDLGDLKVYQSTKSDPVASVKAEDDRRKDSGNVANLKNQSVSGNGVVSRSKLGLSTCVRRKIFKSPSSFSYRRLMPYLMDIVNDDSGVSEIEIVEARIPDKLQRLTGANVRECAISESSYTASVENGMSCNEQNLSCAQNGLDQSSRAIEVDNNTNENGSSGINAVVEEECCRTTPPDANNTFIEFGEAVHSGQYTEANGTNNLIAENQTLEGFSVGIGERRKNVGFGQSPDGKLSSTNSVNRSVLNPCSRLKVFKNPRSLSYRRLLPFLMDISKHNSCCPKPQVDLEEDLNSVSSATADQDYVNKTETDQSHGKHHEEDKGRDLLSYVNSILPSDGSLPDTDPSPVSSTLPTPSVASRMQNEAPSLLELKPEGITQPQCSSSPSELELNLNCCIEHSTSNHKILTELSTSNESEPIVAKDKCLDTGIGINGDLNQNSYQIDMCDASVITTPSSNGSLKGILKRNPRGCRGLCNCLNCASFRLHADRAFEFSRNQMQDAEEIATDLMKELSNLRTLLETSCINENDPSAIKLNPVHVKLACNGALETENQAKERLFKLNNDLNIHCRIPDLLQPKVTFANHFQERAIPMLAPSASARKR